MSKYVYRKVLIDVGHNDFSHKLPDEFPLTECYQSSKIIGKCTNFVRDRHKLYCDISSDFSLVYRYPGIAVTGTFSSLNRFKVTPEDSYILELISVSSFPDGEYKLKQIKPRLINTISNFKF